MRFINTTDLDTEKLHRLILRHTAPYAHDRLTITVRYSRRADFSGACYYRGGRIFVNLGRSNRYPYTLGTYIAKARSYATHWSREVFRLTVADAYQLALFVYLHELFHHLVKAAGRCVRRKEAMCDRFAVKALVDHFHCPLLDSRGRRPARNRWDFQDLHGFVAAAPRDGAVPPAAPRKIPVVIRGAPLIAAPAVAARPGHQLALFGN
jgi:hypothetical protein